MTGHDGNVSPPAPQRAGRSISGSSAMPGSADAKDGGRGMNRANELAIAGGSSATSVVGNAPPRGQFCRVCGKEFASMQAVYGHMRMHPKEREGASLLKVGQIKSNRTVGSGTKGEGSTVAEGSTSPSVVAAQRKTIHKELDLNREPPEDDENDDEVYGGDNGGA